ncbi:MAG: preprotein translocase subunit SecE [Alphaproteobacteria bacterium]|nr:preprotein translocase subunit SecE [Alphaproteobacteria bacterium]
MSDNKDLPSPVRRSGGPLALYGEVVREMKKVTWPTWKETYLTTFMVFVMVALTVVFFFFIDTVLSWGERLLVGAVG